MHRWSVVSGLIESDEGLLLVANRRRNGSVDWSPPGGVVDEGEQDLPALSREVVEETGLVVASWHHEPVYDIRVQFAERDWDLRVAVYRAARWSGALTFADPDGIVHDAVFGAPEHCTALLADSPRWVADPVCEWLAERWTDTRRFAFSVRSAASGALVVDRLVP